MHLSRQKLTISGFCLLLASALMLPATALGQNGDEHQESFSFSASSPTYEEHFNTYRGSAETLPAYLSISWDEGRLANPFGGVGDLRTDDPDNSYGNLSAYTADGESFSFGIRERAPDDLRDARLFFHFRNDTDEPLSVFHVSYDVEAWFIGDRRNRIRLKFDNTLDSDSRDTFETDIFSTDNPSAETSVGVKVDGSQNQHRITVSAVVDITTIDDGTGTMFEPLQPGEQAWFRWQFSNADDDGGSLRSGLAINNIVISAGAEQEVFAFTDEHDTFEQNFNEYRGSLETLPASFTVTWDQGRLANPFGGVGDFITSDPTSEYGNLAAYTADGDDFSFGIRERAPDNLRDARLFFRFRNDTSEPLSVFHVSYDVEAWFIGDRRNRIRLKFDNVLDSDSRDTFETDIFSTDNPSAETTPDTKVNGALEVNRVHVSGLVDITTIDDGSGAMFEPLQPGQEGWFRWQFSNADDDDGDLRSGLAINNLVISTNTESTNAAAVPELASGYELFQNYPNPFNPATTIRFELPASSEVRLDVYDLMGRRVQTLVNNTLAAGLHSVSFDASNLASGAYIYRLQAGAFQQNRVMTLMK